MATKKRLIDANALKKEIVDFKVNLHPQNQDYGIGYFSALSVVEGMLAYAPTVDAVILPYEPRPMLKDRNPHNTDVYCPECGTNLSGYYGDEPLPIVTCFNCGEILDPYKVTTGTNGERKDNERKTD